MDESKLDIVLEQLAKLTERVLVLEQQSAHKPVAFKVISEAEKESALKNGLPIYIAQLLPVYRAITYLRDQITSGNMRVLSSTTEPRFPLGKFEQLIVQFGGEYRQRATLQQLRKWTGIDIATLTGRTSVMDFDLARIRMQDRHGIYQVKFNTRAVELHTLYRAAEELAKLFETVEAYKPEMANIKRNYNATYLQELSTVCAEIISAEGHRTAKYVRKDPELSIACSPAAREQILPSWRLPSDVTMVHNSMPTADAESSVSSNDPNVVDLATGDIRKWWLHRGIELDEKLMPNTHDLYPNPQEVMARRTSEDININTGRSFADDARILQLIIDGQLPDAFPKGETFNALDFLDDND